MLIPSSVHAERAFTGRRPAATLRLLDDGDLRARVAAHARQLVEQRYDWTAIGAAYAADIRRLAYHRSP